MKLPCWVLLISLSAYGQGYQPSSGGYSPTVSAGTGTFGSITVTNDATVGGDVKLTDGNKTFYNVPQTMHIGGDGFGTLILDAPVNIRLDAPTSIFGVTTLGQDRANYLEVSGATTGNPPTITQMGETGVGLTISAGTGPINLGAGFSVDATGLVSAGEAVFTGEVLLNGGFNLGGTSDSITESQSCSSALNFGSIAAGADAELTFTCTGAAVGDPAVPIWPTTIEAGLTGMMWVSDANTMRVRLSNIQLLGSIDPASQSFAARTFNP